MPKKLTLCLFFLTFTTLAWSQDHLLMPDEFFLQKGDPFSVHALVSDNLTDTHEEKYASTLTNRFELLEGGKKTDVRPLTKDSAAPVFKQKASGSGLTMLVMERKSATLETQKEQFNAFLLEEGLLSIQAGLEKSEKESFREKSACYLKTMAYTDKPSGAVYSEKLGQDLEIILLQNPYKLQYGDDETAQVFFKGKPLTKAQVGVQTRSSNGKIFVTSYTTDTEGKIYFKMNRSGTWVVRLVYMLPSTDASADFQTWRASFSFGFRG